MSLRDEGAIVQRTGRQRKEDAGRGSRRVDWWQDAAGKNGSTSLRCQRERFGGKKNREAWRNEGRRKSASSDAKPFFGQRCCAEFADPCST